MPSSGAWSPAMPKWTVGRDFKVRRYQYARWGELRAKYGVYHSEGDALAAAVRAIAAEQVRLARLARTYADRHGELEAE